MERFSLEQAMRAQALLRREAGLPAQDFSTGELVGMLSDEIEQLRALHRSDCDISALLADHGICVSASDVARYYAPPELRLHPGAEAPPGN